MGETEQIQPTQVARVVETDTIIPIAKILEYKAQKLSHAEIAKLVGCSKQNVTQRLAPYREHVNGLDAFKERKADVLQVKQSMLLSHLSPSIIKEMSGYQAVGSFGILYDKGRLEEGKSTSNVSLADAALRLSESMDDLDKEIASLDHVDVNKEGE